MQNSGFVTVFYEIGGMISTGTEVNNRKEQYIASAMYCWKGIQSRHAGSKFLCTNLDMEARLGFTSQLYMSMISLGKGVWKINIELCSHSLSEMHSDSI